MAIKNFGLREMIVEAVGDDMTLYLHTGDPGTAGTANRLPTATLAGQTITATTDWTIHASQGRAEIADDVDFGNAGAAATGVNWYTLFKGANYYADRGLTAAMDVANGAPVTLTGSSVVVEITSTDA